MLGKENGIKQTAEAKQYFSKVKKALIEAHVLVSPIFSKEFMIFSFASKHTIAGVLLQINEQNLEQPIAFYIQALRDSSLKYDIMKKQAYALIKSFKEFRVYILHSHSIVYVPSVAIKDIRTQSDPDGRRAKWISTFLEYDLEIKLKKLVKGQGLAKLMAQSNYEVLGVNFFDLCLENVAQVEGRKAHPDFVASSWYKDTYMSCKIFKLHLN